MKRLIIQLIIQTVVWYQPQLTHTHQINQTKRYVWKRSETETTMQTSTVGHPQPTATDIAPSLLHISSLMLTKSIQYLRNQIFKRTCNIGFITLCLYRRHKVSCMSTATLEGCIQGQYYCRTSVVQKCSEHLGFHIVLNTIKLCTEIKQNPRYELYMYTCDSHQTEFI